MQNLDRLVHAFQSPSLPCNPLPFALGLSEYVRAPGRSIKSDEAKAILWVLLAQAYDSTFATVDLQAEWTRLDKSLPEPEEIARRAAWAAKAATEAAR